MKKILLLSLICSYAFSRIPEYQSSQVINAKGTMTSAEDAPPWFNSSPQNSSYEGISSNLVYQDFGTPSHEVIVAVIDSGVDVNHEDLKGRIWVNEDEIPNDGIDNDNNGYIDDVHGWNFLGTSKGMASFLNDGTLVKGDSRYQADAENLEFAREIRRMESISRVLTKAEEAYLNKLIQYKNQNPCYRVHHCQEEPNSLRVVINKEKSQGVYGNNDVIGPDSRHGTHVAGIIAANRSNSIGMKGVASNAKIMVLRAVPDGDEYDGDVANSIIYAVNNGAKVINMSFGKSFSPKKGLVDRAVTYAEQNGVLLVHAAGNSSRRNFPYNNFPNRVYKNSLYESQAWLEVGASSKTKGSRLSASFSNYSKEYVDLFAPGVSIYSTVPNNNYESLQGTSMASPVVAGAAALVLGYFPDLYAQEITNLFSSTVKLYPGLKVYGPRYNAYFEELSTSGGILDVHNAMKVLTK